MDNENKKSVNKQLIIRILVPVLLVCIVAGVWLAKNWSDTRDALTDNKGASSQAVSAADGEEDDEVADCCVSPPQEALDGLEKSEADPSDAE